MGDTAQRSVSRGLGVGEPVWWCWTDDGDGAAGSCSRNYRAFSRYELNGGFFPSLFNFKGQKETFVPFLATEIFYNNIQFDRQRTFMINCGDDCNYYTEIEYGLNRKLFGGRFQMGFISQIFEPVFLEAAFAFGFMGFDLNADQRKPIEFEREYGYLFEENDIDTLLPTIDLSLKLVFQLLK